MPEQSRKELTEYENFLFYVFHLNTLYNFTHAQFWLF